MKQNLQWDIFCQVIDNFGDIGVCWRLACDLAARGQRVRLWVDDPSSLSWMAPGGCTGVKVLPLPSPAQRERVPGRAEKGENHPSNVLVETFGCEIAPEFIANYVNQSMATGQKPAWINLEHLSAEPFVERCHGLPSPVMIGPAKGWTKRFFYPGFTKNTGGLLRELDFEKRQTDFDRIAWLTGLGINWQGQRIVSLFCYEPAALPQLLNELSQEPTLLLVTAGRASRFIKKINRQRPLNKSSLLSISYLQEMPQTEFDKLLWASDLNFVRGEDSLVRAIWAGKPFVWHIYPQTDGAHGPKLEAFLEVSQAPESLRMFHRQWNGDKAPDKLEAVDSPGWQAWARALRERLLKQPSLGEQLLQFVGSTHPAW